MAEQGKSCAKENYIRHKESEARRSCKPRTHQSLQAQWRQCCHLAGYQIQRPPPTATAIEAQSVHRHQQHAAALGAEQLQDQQELQRKE